MRASLLILAKDLRLRARDRSVFVFAFVIPLGLTFLFSAMFPDDEDLQVTAAVVDEDGGPITASFVDQVLPAVEEAGFLILETAANRAVAEQALRDGDLQAAWIVPPGFTDAVTSGQPAEIEVLVAAGSPIAGEVARGVATTWTSRLEAAALTVASSQRLGIDQVDAESLGSEVAASPPSVTVGSLLTADRELDMASYLAAGMASFFVFFTVQFGVLGLLEERTVGTLPRLLAAPVPAWSVQVGKALGAGVLGLVSMTVLAVASAMLLGASWGPAVGSAVLVVALVSAALGIMALVGSYARTAEQAGNYQAIVAIVLGMLGGVFIPLPTTSRVVELATLASPHGWFLRGISDQASTGDWTQVLPAAGAIVLFAVVTAVPAAWRLRRAATW